MTLDKYLAQLNPLQQDIARDLQLIVLGNFPDLSPTIKYNIPFFVYNGWIAYYCTYAQQKKQGIYLCFCRGTLLRDTEQLLEGDGNTIKKLYLHDRADLKNLWPAIAQFLIESMMINDLKKGKRNKKI